VVPVAVGWLSPWSGFPTCWPSIYRETVFIVARRRIVIYVRT